MPDDLYIDQYDEQADGVHHGYSPIPIQSFLTSPTYLLFMSTITMRVII